MSQIIATPISVCSPSARMRIPTCRVHDERVLPIENFPLTYESLHPLALARRRTWIRVEYWQAVGEGAHLLGITGVETQRLKGKDTRKPEGD